MDRIIETIKKIVELADDYDIQVRSYSGRGMYGKSCLGLVGRQSDVMNLLIKSIVEAVKLTRRSDTSADKALDHVSDIFEEFGRMSVDSMGRSSIYYFEDMEIKIGDEIDRIIDGDDSDDDEEYYEDDED